MLEPSPEKQKPPWAQELQPLPIPYPPRTQLKGDAAALFKKCVIGAYGKGGSIRDIAGRTNRSYGVVHRVLVDAPDVKLRKRGGRHRPVGPTVA
ncbi:helix-turn-helix domain-containing protein [Streptomyces turgidiscabies]|uniref:Helix-turn-helix domain-containing protein n=1 Tax=Streptomyces turgidiscabies (strain Car8) TaxID=698760 RepID=L7EPT3_STRT8|nr:MULTISPECIES: helix-turn-helix domain-containing protein [Streptomyces]ELP61483.1 hypothetical protein STRTUCAR8_03662 [Streptomyces turgidiscabies Car8]MDX3497275.1 helix-turn-helix domain-containing protein [Streptomyces turgidiscabies]GAQ68628.1 hypothetical protein T45_00340 [Streptomyces turgidiscabies]